MFKSHSGSDVEAIMYVTWAASLERVLANYRIRVVHVNPWVAVFSVSFSEFNYKQYSILLLQHECTSAILVRKNREI